ncbi:MAG: amino acid permease [Arenimonas sp.]|nr:amino acid permease [Arenimonas sp.]
MAPKKIGVLLATFVVANNMIGSGFFLLPASLASQGSVTALSWLVGTVIAVVLGGAFARLARDYPNLNCPDDYVRPALGRDMGFLATTLYWAASWAGNNAVAVAAFGYLVILLPLDGNDTAVRLGGQLALIWLMLAINLAGPRRVATFQSFCVVFGLLPVAVVLVGGWTRFDPALFTAGWNVTGTSDAAVVFGNLAPVFWSFIGLETGAMVAGIVDDPDRNVPRATIAGILLAGVVYLVSSVLVMGIVPASELAASGAPFALVAAAIFGPWAAVAIAAAAALKATGTLGGWMLVAGEAGARAAHRGYLPAIFGRLRANGAAAWGLVIVTVAMTGIAFATVTPTVAGQFGAIIGMVTLLIVLAYMAAGLALMVGTPERPSGRREKWLGAVSLLACALLVFTSPWTLIAGSLAVTLLAWGLFRAVGRRAA